MKNVIVDASSAILLLKAGLFDDLLAFYRVSCTQSVLQELTCEKLCGAATFSQYAADRQIEVIDSSDAGFSPAKTLVPVDGTALGRGEKDSISCFGAGGWDFIIIDDGKAARYCSRNSIPFINALLFPRILFLCRWVTLAESNEKMKLLASIGRYGEKIVAWAQNCNKVSLLFAVPINCGKNSSGAAGGNETEKHEDKNSRVKEYV